MSTFLASNWPWILLVGGMLLMHLGHGHSVGHRASHRSSAVGHAVAGCGGHGTHAVGQPMGSADTLHTDMAKHDKHAPSQGTGRQYD